MVAKKQTEIRVRIAPSPTGYLHIGTARTALFNYLFARQKNGTFILRIEDTDKERSKKEYETEIISSLIWLGLEYDEGPLKDDEEGASKLLAKPFKGDLGPYRQSERLDIYEKYLKQLLLEKRAYYCFCSQEDLDAQRESMMAQGKVWIYPGTCRTLSEKEADVNRANGAGHVIRIKVPSEKLSFKDVLRKEITFDTALIGDIVVAKNLREPLYNFAVVVDDYQMRISHVIRGEDHIANTPKQMVIARSLGFPFPEFAHLPLILNTDKSKMSKRDGGASLSDYRKAGYLPEAIINFLALLGWHPEGEQEVLTLSDLIAKFDLSRVQKSGAVFNVDRLDWFNAYYIKQKSDTDLLDLLTPEYLEPSWASDSGKLLKVIALVKERLKKLSEFKDLSRLFFELPEYSSDLLVWKKSTPQASKENLTEIKNILENLPEVDFQKSRLESAIMSLAQAKGRGDVLWPLRVAVSGSQNSPGPFEIIDALGKSETLRRIDRALVKLSTL